MFGSAAAISWLILDVAAVSIVDVPWEARRSNIIRVTRQPCDDCSTLEQLYQDNELVFLLFYERNLVSHHAYKGAIIAGFHEACKDLRWSRVACGIVDMLDDRAYAEKYIDPKTAPAHIAVKAGEPMPSKQEWIKKLLAKPGDKATMLWHLNQQLVPDELGDPLQISVTAKEAQLQPLTSKHEVVVVANVGQGSVESFRASVQKLILRKEVPEQVPVATPKNSASKKALKKLQQARQRARVLFVAVTSAADIPRGKVAAFVRGQIQPPRDLQTEWDGPSNMDAIKEVALAAVSAVSTGKAPNGKISEL
mmetsp:Transcript_39181/g.93665  ORF Transcript_39181/g.93665 Transcript_39181/m.93665 type:complete len:308 (+) Transcript_39181:41-964(+)